MCYNKFKVQYYYYSSYTDSHANNITTAAIVVPLSIVLLTLILLVILVVVVTVKCLTVTPKLTVHIAFSVEDKPGSLAGALKVFKDCKVNILGLNTHLHHAKFDRDAGNGYIYNYVHCMCTKDEKEFLKNEIKAELENGMSILTPYIVFIMHTPSYQLHGDPSLFQCSFLQIIKSLHILLNIVLHWLLLE